MSAAQSAQTLLVLNVVLMFAYLLLGWVMPRLAARGWSTLSVTVVGSLLMIGAQAVIVLAGGTWAWLAWLPFAVGVTVFTPVQTHVSLTFRGALTGRAFSAFNMMIFVGIFFTQWLFGVLVDALGRQLGLEEALAFRWALACWLVLQVLALAVMIGWRVKPPGGQSAAM
jgi:MFS family permease